MSDYFQLGSCPYYENPTQIGTPGFTKKNYAECSRFLNGLKKRWPRMDFKIQTNRHEFGSYREVAVRCEEADQISYDLAFEVENNLPATWTELENF